MALWIRKIKHMDGSIREIWYATIFFPTGRRYQNGKPVYDQDTFSLDLDAKTVSRKKAQAEFDKRKQEMIDRHGKPPAPDSTLPDFVPHYLAYCRDVIGKSSWDRDEQSLRHLVKFFGASRLSEITPKDCVEYQHKRKNDGISNRTVNLELTCLRHLYNVARLREVYTGDNPVRKVRFLEVLPGKDRVLSPEEEERLMAASPAFLRDILTCALQTGMRKAEILFLEWENIDLRNNYIYIESARAKTRRVRKVPISSTLKDLFIRLKAASKSSRVFMNSKGKPYKVGTAIQGIFEKARREAGIEDFRFHDLRHTVATRLVEGGADIFRVAKILGHQDVRMTSQRYAHPDQSLKNDIEILSGYNHDNSINTSNGDKSS